MLLGGVGMSGLALGLLPDNLLRLTTWFATSTLACAALSTVILNLPADLYPTRSVASVSVQSRAHCVAGTSTIAEA
jgi:hypothetical protein